MEGLLSTGPTPSSFLLPSKLHAVAINDLQYCGGKMATKSEMFVKVQTQSIKKYWPINKPKKINFEDSLTNLYNRFYFLFCQKYKPRLSKKKLPLKINQKIKFLKTLSLTYTRDFLFCLEQYAWLESRGFQDLFGTDISWLLNISSELCVLSSPGTT